MCFNVKGGDLLFIDHAPLHTLSEHDLKVYQAVGIQRSEERRVGKEC